MGVHDNSIYPMVSQSLVSVAAWPHEPMHTFPGLGKEQVFRFSRWPLSGTRTWSPVPFWSQCKEETGAWPKAGQFLLRRNQNLITPGRPFNGCDHPFLWWQDANGKSLQASQAFFRTERMSSPQCGSVLQFGFSACAYRISRGLNSFTFYLKRT